MARRQNCINHSGMFIRTFECAVNRVRATMHFDYMRFVALRAFSRGLLARNKLAATSDSTWKIETRVLRNEI